MTDSITAVAYGKEKSEPDQMHQPPRRKDTPILGMSGIATIIDVDTYTGPSSWQEQQRLLR